MRHSLRAIGAAAFSVALCSAVFAQQAEKIISPLAHLSKNAKEMDSDLVIVAMSRHLPFAEKKNIAGESILTVRSDSKSLHYPVSLCIIADAASYPGLSMDEAKAVLSSVILPWLSKAVRLTQPELKSSDCLTEEGNFLFSVAQGSAYLVAVERSFLPALLAEPGFQQNPQAAVVVGAISKEFFSESKKRLADKKQQTETALRDRIKALADAAGAGEVSTLGAIVVSEPSDKVQLCAVETGEAGTPFLLGYSFGYVRYLPEQWIRQVTASNPRLRFEETRYFHKTFKSIDDFYIKLQGSECNVFVGTPVEVNALRSALLRDSGKEHNVIGTFVSKNELAENWAKAVGFDSFNQSVFANKIEADAATVKSLAQYQITSEQALNDAFVAMRSSGYADANNPKLLLGFLRDNQAGKNEGKTAVAIRAERQQKEAREAEQRAVEQKKAREEYAKKFPFTAVISCSLGESSLIPLNACFFNRYTQTELEVKNGADYRMYTPRDLSSAGQVTDRGLEIPLQKSFSIKAQNAGENVLLTVTVIDNRSGSVAFKKSASQYGVVRAQN
jgi:hypothetical protein